MKIIIKEKGKSKLVQYTVTDIILNMFKYQLKIFAA